jgi:hypothetical protein
MLLLFGRTLPEQTSGDRIGIGGTSSHPAAVAADAAWI